MSGTYIKSESDQGVLILTMHDPKTRNAIGLEMMAELEEELDRFESSPTLRALVLTGSDPLALNLIPIACPRLHLRDPTACDHLV